MDITLLPGQHQRTVRDVKGLVRDWVAQQARSMPDLRAAHLTGGITALAEIDLFPAEKDVDVHLIFPEQSAILQVADMPLLEAQFAGLAIEAGLKPLTWYRSPQAVLGNPEIAYHLTRDTILYDPAGHLLALHPEVRRRYAEPQFVQERIAWERRGQEGAFALYEQLEQTAGPVASLNIMGYTATFAAAALSVARLAPPRQGGRVFLHLRQELAQVQRLDLYEAILEALVGVEWSSQPALRAESVRRVSIIAEKCMTVRTPGAAALSLCYVGAGAFDVYFNARLSAWDVASGALVITEAPIKPQERSPS